jgi:hypothetical protein
LKLAVAYPWDSPFMFTRFSESALNMKDPVGYEVRWFRGHGETGSIRHTNVLEKSIEWGADTVCFIGADQVHPEDMFERLVARNKEGFRVISATVPMRGYIEGQSSKPFQPMAWRRGNGPNGFVPIKIEDGNVQPIDIIGSGVLMFPASIIQRMSHPWFEYLNDPNNSNKTGGCDSKFVWKIKKETGEQVFVDTTIKVKHLHVFEIDESYQDRFKDWEDGNGDPAICVYKEKSNV